MDKIEAEKALYEVIATVQYMINNALAESTKVYEGVITSVGENKANVRFNGEVHEIAQFGDVNPSVGDSVKVIIPQGNMNLAWFVPKISDGGGGGLVYSYGTGDPPATGVEGQLYFKYEA